MKRIIYTLTAIFSAITAAVSIIEYITNINEYGEFYFDFYRCTFIPVLLAFSVFSLIQLKKHTPRVMLIFSGYALFAASMTMYNSYLCCLLLLAAALMPAIYELSHYGMAVRQEPKRSGQFRWMLIAAMAMALALTAYRVMVSIYQSALYNYDTLDPYSVDIMGISVLLSAAVFCALMNRRTSVLYRMFFTGCIVFDAILTVLPRYGFFSFGYPSDAGRILFISVTAVYALFVLLMLLHAFLTRHDGLVSQERGDSIQQAETPAA